jgi:predicted TIM-barrel fold metal-dependent hydrolase
MILAGVRQTVVISVLMFSANAASAQPGGSNQGTAIRPGEACPAGMTEIRPGRCMQPQIPPPSIVDYRPRSTLVTREHKVPKAKYPAIDIHGHVRGWLTSADSISRLLTILDSINIGVMVSADNYSGEQLQRVMALINSSPRGKDRIRVFAGIDFRNVGPGWAEKAIEQLRADVAAGAVGVGEVSKGLGLSITKADGSRLRIDDRALDPVWRECARLGIPVFIHTADPEEFFKDSIGYTNERWLELALFPQRRYPPSRYPSFDQLMAERDNLFRNNPQTTFIAAHMGWHANDLARLGKLLTERPNVYVEVGAILYDIGRQPRAAHDFFVKFQDRVLFGKDSFQPEEYPYYWRVFETRDDYFDYYRDYHAFWKLYGIDLSDAVLRKLYYGNALRIARRLPRAGWAR